MSRLNQKNVFEMPKTVLGTEVDREKQDTQRLRALRTRQRIGHGILKAVTIAAGILGAGYAGKEVMAKLPASTDTMTAPEKDETPDNPSGFHDSQSSRDLTNCLQSPELIQLDTREATDHCLAIMQLPLGAIVRHDRN